MRYIKPGDYVKTIEKPHKEGRVMTVEGDAISVYISDETGCYSTLYHAGDLAQVKECGSVQQDIDSIQEEIEKPKRYNKRGKLECWDVILDQEMDFLEGNILKYLWRHREKNGVEDLKKARVYLDKLISQVEKREK